MTEFGSPLAFLLLLALAGRVALLLRDRRRRSSEFVYSSTALAASASTFRLRARWIPFVLESIGWILLVVALARPQSVITSAADDRFGIDLVIALDGSGSMAAEDFRPRNRFAVARDLISEFIARRQNDRIGIVTFGSRAATRVPITFDHDMARRILDEARIGDNGDGTAIGHAIATGVNRLRSSESRSRVLILVTDGVNNSGSIDPVAASALAARFGIRIYTIGVGSRGEVPIPVKVQNRFTGEIETVYHVIRADLDEPMLSGIAKETGGRYFRAVDQNALGSVLDTIDRLEKSQLTAPKRRNIDERYKPPLAAGFFAILLAVLIGETLWLKLPA